MPKGMPVGASQQPLVLNSKRLHGMPDLHDTKQSLTTASQDTTYTKVRMADMNTFVFVAHWPVVVKGC